MVTPGLRWLAALLVSWGMMVGTHAPAGQAYRWVDDAGVVQFSDIRPDGAADVRILTVPSFGPASMNPEDDYYSIVNQSRRMEERRLAAERQRAEHLRAERNLALQEQSLSARWAAPPPYPPRSIVRWRPWPYGHFCRPGHPACKPPVANTRHGRAYWGSPNRRAHGGGQRSGVWRGIPSLRDTARARRHR